MLTKKTLSLFVMLILFAGLLMGCANKGAVGETAEGTGVENDKNDENNEIAEVEIPSEPVTIKIWHWMGEEQFNKFYKEPVEEKFDHITFELVSGGPDRSTIEELLTKKERPDIIWGGAPWQMQLYEEFELIADMSELMERFGYNYDHLDQGGIQDVSNYFKPGEFNALPHLVSRMALHYNKDIFDLFGVSYPTDDMTWEEVTALASKVTGERNGTHYTGLGLDANNFLSMMAGAPVLDAETHEPIISKSDKWRRALETINKIYEIPGNLPEDLTEESFYHGSSFGGDKTLAMAPTWFNGGLADVEGLNWDVVTYPVWEDSPNQAPVTSQWLGVASTSEHPEEAFRVLSYLLSEEHLTSQYSGSASIPQIPLGNVDVISSIEPYPGLEEIDYMSTFKHELTVGQDEYSKYEGVLGRLPDSQIPKHIIFSSQDLNTAIRLIEEWATQQVEEAIAEE